MFASPGIRSRHFLGSAQDFKLKFARISKQEGAESEAFYHALGTLLSRWLLARSDYPEMEAIKLFAKVRSYVARPERFL
jgi:hypothetical protein